MRNDDKKLVGNANNEPSEDSVTKIQKAALWFKPRLDSPLHWSKTSKPVSWIRLLLHLQLCHHVFPHILLCWFYFFVEGNFTKLVKRCCQRLDRYGNVLKFPVGTLSAWFHLTLNLVGMHLSKVKCSNGIMPLLFLSTSNPSARCRNICGQDKIILYCPLVWVSGRGGQRVVEKLPTSDYSSKVHPVQDFLLDHNRNGILIYKISFRLLSVLSPSNTLPLNIQNQYQNV